MKMLSWHPRGTAEKRPGHAAGTRQKERGTCRTAPQAHPASCLQNSTVQALCNFFYTALSSFTEPVSRPTISTAGLTRARRICQRCKTSGTELGIDAAALPWRFIHGPVRVPLRKSPYVASTMIFHSLFLQSGAEVTGEITGAEPIRLGTEPPGLLMNPRHICRLKAAEERAACATPTAKKHPKFACASSPAPVFR